VVQDRVEVDKVEADRAEADRAEADKVGVEEDSEVQTDDVPKGSDCNEYMGNNKTVAKKLSEYRGLKSGRSVQLYRRCCT